LDNKVRISCVLIENFPPKKEIYSKLRLLSSSSAIPTWLIPRDSILTGQHYDFRTIQTRLYSRKSCHPRHLRIQFIVSTIMTEWARCCLHSEPSSTTTRHIKGFHNPNTKRVLNITTNIQYLFHSTTGPHATSITRKDQGVSALLKDSTI